MTGGKIIPNTIKVTDFGVEPELDLPFLVMELLRGESLWQILRGEQPLPHPRLVHIFSQVGASLKEAHAHGLIHRDLKPSNIFVTQLGGVPDVVKVLDFGLAKSYQDTGSAETEITRTGEVLGTPHYMSPEQAQAKPLGPASDLYSLGVVLYEALTGQRPFEAPSYASVLLQHCTLAPEDPRRLRPDLGIPEDLAAVALRALAKEPTDRFAGAAEMRAALLATEAASQSYTVEGESEPFFPADLSSQPMLGQRTAASPGATSVRSPRGTSGSFGVVLSLAAVVLALLFGAAGIVGWVVSRQRGGLAEEPPNGGDTPGQDGTAGVRAASSRVSDEATGAGRSQELALRVTSEPAGAEVLEGREFVGKTPLRLRRLSRPEPLRLRLRHPDCETLSIEMPLEADGPPRLMRHVALHCTKRRTRSRPHRESATARSAPWSPPAAPSSGRQGGAEPTRAPRPRPPVSPTSATKPVMIDL